VGLTTELAGGMMLTVIPAVLVFVVVRRYIRLRADTVRSAPLVEKTAGWNSTRKDLQMILDAMPAMIAYWDKNLIMVFANRARELWFGADPGTLPGKHIREFLGEEQFQRDLTHIEAALRGETQTFEQSITKPGGAGFRHSLTNYVPDIENGVVRGFYVLVYDVSELTENRLQLAVALREKDELLRTLDLHSKVTMSDDKGYITYVNENFCRILGFRRDEVLGRPYNIINSGVQNREFWTRMWNTISAGTPWRGEICNRGKDGSLHWVDAIVAPFLGKDGRVQKYVSIGTDISASKASEFKLRNNEVFLERIGTIAAVGGWEFDLGSGKVTWSSQTYRMFELDSDYEPQADTQLVYYAAEGRTAIETAMAECIECGTAWDLELPAATAKGRPIWVRSIGSPEREDGRIVRILGAVQDVTARKTIETQLRDSTNRFSIAESANKAKSQFLANMSHEIRTPMNAVMGLSYLLSHTSLTAEQSNLLAKIRMASNSLLSVITNILDLSKIEANELLVESTVFSLSDLLRDVGVLMTVQAEAKGIEFSMDSPNDLPDALVGDPTRLKQILINLLSNAIRFTNEGSVRFTTTRREAISEAAIMSFAVTDTGIGIAPEEQRKIFAPFAQADASITRRYGGTGLGLSIVKQLTQLLCGTVDLKSVVGIGSTFTVALPFPLADPAALAALREATVTHVPGALRGIRVLIVDDSDINLEVARRLLELDGALVSLAVNGQQAFDCLKAEPDAFDVVFMDVQMPVLDGYEATRRIRKELGLSNLPIIAVTAGALSSERQRAEDAGMSDFICKPFSGKTLAGTILSHIPAVTSQRAALHSGGTGISPALTVPWPDIDGIDAADAHARWCGDAPLFIKMLSRLFVEFGAVRFPADVGIPGAVAQHVRQMHKLRGGACMLGAKAISALAGEIEAACVSEDFDRAAKLTTRLSTEIQQLSGNAQTAIAAERIRADDSHFPCAVTIAPPLIQQFSALLRQQSLTAVDSFRSLSPQLRQSMGRVLYEQMRTQIDNLQFEDASRLLESTQRQSAAMEDIAAVL
jgi:PAS domain S-box-containing protein